MEFLSELLQLILTAWCLVLLGQGIAGTMSGNKLPGSILIGSATIALAILRLG